MTSREPVLLLSMIYGSPHTMLTAQWVAGGADVKGKTDWIELISIRFSDNSTSDEVKVKVLRISPTAQAALVDMIEGKGQRE